MSTPAAFTLAVAVILATGLAVLVGYLVGYLVGTRRRMSAPALTDALRPVDEGIGRLTARLEEVERQRAAEQAGLAATLTEQVRYVAATADSVRRETTALHAALGRSTVRGSWGEAALRRLVEASGLLERVHFVEQGSHEGEDGRLRPDMTINLGQGRIVAVDAKVSLEAFLVAQECDDPVAREQAMAAHAASVSRHIDALGAKEYWKSLESCEFVVAYLPSEALLAAALAADPSILDRAFRRSVVLATPSTMFALLRTIEMGWRQQSLAEHAEQIATIGGELYERLVTMAGHLDALGKQLGGATRAYNSYVGSLESRVLVSARRMADLGVGSGTVDPPRQVEVVPRALTHEGALTAPEQTHASAPADGGAAVA